MTDHDDPITWEIAYNDNDFGVVNYDGSPPTQRQVDETKEYIEDYRRQREYLNLGGSGRVEAAKMIESYCNTKGDRRLTKVIELRPSMQADLPYHATAQVKYGDAPATQYFLLNLETAAIKCEADEEY